MVSESGGAPARRGFEYQDYAAAYYFLHYTDAHEIHIERYEDFALFYYEGEFHIKNFFEAKSQKGGQFTKADFRRKVADNFADLVRDHKEEDTVVHLHLVTNVKLHKKLRDFFDDVKALRTNAMQWHTFKNQHDREFLKPLREETGLNDANLQAFLSGLHHHFHSREELELKVENHLRECNPGKFRKGTRQLMQLIHETDSDTITRDKVEEKIGFSLQKRDTSTSSTRVPGEELREEVREIQTKHEDASVDVVSPIEEREQMGDFISGFEGAENINSNVVEGQGARIDERYKELEELRTKERSIHNELASDIEVLLDMDDSTSSEGGEVDD